MSWGERSCAYKGKCPVDGGPTIGTCNVDCPSYFHDGETTPDTVPYAGPRPKTASALKQWLSDRNADIILDRVADARGDFDLSGRRFPTRNQRKRARKKRR